MIRLMNYDGPNIQRNLRWNDQSFLMLGPKFLIEAIDVKLFDLSPDKN